MAPKVHVTTLSGSEGLDLSDRTTPSPGRSETHDNTDPFPRGHLIGRYVIVDKVGSGGMGVVYAAYDPDLGRKIAIKILREHPVNEEWGGGSQGTILLREAQAMALLSHPNVLPVHDVGVVDGRVFIATEFVEGQTLRQWLSQTPRSWKEIVAVFVEAGRGLAAAHRAGLIHRDFKPGNVMVSVQGVVRVMDFGLARLASAQESDTDASLPGTNEQTTDRFVLGSTFTVTGTVLGTPAYMAPEQNAGVSVNAAADQYSFCVALYESLFGRRPTRERTPPARRYGVNEKGLEKNRAQRVPRWLKRVIERGLATAPGERWPSMDELLHALQVQPMRRKRRLVLGGTALIAVLGSAGTVAGLNDRSEPCGGARELGNAMWTNDLKTRIDDAFHRTQRHHASVAATRLFGLVDEYVEEWVDTRTQACRATRVYHEQPELVMDRKLQCLDDNRKQVGAFLGALERSTSAQTVDRAIDEFQRMSSFDLCKSADALARKHEIPIPDSERHTVEAIRDAVVQLNAMVAVGDGTSAKAYQATVRSLLERVTHGPTRTEALWSEFGAARLLGDKKRAGDLLVEVRDLAARHGNRGLLTSVWSQKLWMTAVEERRMEVARELVPVLEVALELAKDEPDQMLRELEARRNLAVMELLAGDLGSAERRYRELDERLPEDPATLNSLGVVLIYRDRTEEARDALLAGQRSLEKRAGPRHPNISDFYNNRALSYQWQGDLQSAEPLYRRAVEVSILVRGDDHLKTMLHRYYLGQLLVERQLWTDAEREIEGALKGLVAVLGEQAEFAIHARIQKARIALGRGEVDRARALMDAVRKDIVDGGLASLTRGHVQPSYVEGLVLLAEGRMSEAESAFETALEAYLEVYEPHSLERVRPLIGLVRVNLMKGDWSAAETSLRQAETLLDGGNSVAEDPRRQELRALRDEWADGSGGLEASGR